MHRMKNRTKNADTQSMITGTRTRTKYSPLSGNGRNCQPEEIYAVVFMNAVHYHVRSEGRIVPGIDMNGKKDVPGMYAGENESAKFWLSIMNGFCNRGAEDTLTACADGLTSVLINRKCKKVCAFLGKWIYNKATLNQV